MLVKPDFDIFKAKFDNPPWAFEWFCYLLFSKEYNQPYGIHRYTNQSGIETDPIQVGDEVIGWQSKFYKDSLSEYKDDLIATVQKAKRDNSNINKIIFYTNSEFGQGQGQKEPKAKTETEQKAKESGIEIEWRTASYFESVFVSQTCRDISRYFFEQNSKWELSDLGFQDVLHRYYADKFQTISFLINNNQKSIEDIYINLAIIKDKKEEQDNKKLISRESFLSSYEEIHQPKEPIAIEELLTKSRKSLIYGKAGIGKTTFCKYIAYKWSKGELYQEFDYVVYIALREWKNGGLKGAIKDNYYSQDEDDVDFDIKSNSSKILFLFDGYDELAEEKKKLLRSEIEKANLSHYIITSRPYGYQRNDFMVDEQFETIGFTDENVQSYIEKFFENDSEQQQRLKVFLDANISIKHIAYIPLMLEMICTLWQDKVQDNEILNSPMTMTELYSDVVEYILEKHAGKKEDTSVYEWENREDIKEFLGKIAFEALQKQNILFDGECVRDTIGRDKIDFFKTSIVNSGFLKSDRKDKSLLGNNFEFPHLTFQEYFAAYYVNTLSQDNQREIIRDWKFYPHMQMFFAFLAGLIEDKEFLLGEIESEPRDIAKVNILNLLLMLGQNLKNNYILNNLKNEIKSDKTITEFAKIQIVNLLFDFSMSEIANEILVEIYGNDKIKLLQNRFILENSMRKFYSEGFQYFIVNDSDNLKFLIRLKKYIQDNKDDYDNVDVTYFSQGFDKNDEKFVDFLIKVLKIDCKFCNKGAAYYLLSLGKSDNKIIDGIVKLVKTRTLAWREIRDVLQLFVSFINQDFNTFPRLYEITRNTKEEYILLKLNIKTLFQAYDENFDVLEYIYQHCQNNNKPLYVKDDKLCTIENGGEIRTEKDIDGKTLNFIKEFAYG